MDFMISRIWLFRGSDDFLDFAISWISQFPEFHNFLSVTISRISHYRVFYNFVDFTICWIVQFPGQVSVFQNFVDFKIAWILQFAWCYNFLDFTNRYMYIYIYIHIYVYIYIKKYKGFVKLYISGLATAGVGSCWYSCVCICVHIHICISIYRLLRILRVGWSHGLPGPQRCRCPSWIALRYNMQSATGSQV